MRAPNQIKLIFFLPAICLTLFSFRDSQPLAESFSGTNPDSVILANHRIEILKEYIESPDSYSPQQIDSILLDEKTTIGTGEIYYAPDKRFKIFLFENEGCGVYCNPSWESFLHFESNGKEIIKRLDLTTIQSIDKLSDGKYLIVQTSYGRPASYYTVVCGTASLLSFDGNSMLEHPISYKEKKEFYYCQENSVEGKDPAIHFNSKKKELTYQYGNYYEENNTDSIYSGIFRYSKGKLSHLKETVYGNVHQK